MALNRFQAYKYSMSKTETDESTDRDVTKGRLSTFITIENIFQ